MSNIGYVHMKKYRRPRRLTKLEISDVSSVSSGAGEDCRVLFMKSANEKTEPMSESGLGVVSVAKRSAEALADGTISQDVYAKLQ
jgi:hypothetical protein